MTPVPSQVQLRPGLSALAVRMTPLHLRSDSRAGPCRAHPLLAWRHQPDYELAHAPPPANSEQAAPPGRTPILHECNAQSFTIFDWTTYCKRLAQLSDQASAVMLAALFVQAVDHELRPIAGQDFLFGGLFLTVINFFSFFRALCGQVLVLGRDGGRLALRLPKSSPGSRHRDQRNQYGRGANDMHA